MSQIPVYSVIAFSNTGKTTLLEKLIPELKSRGYRVAVIKHDAHEFEIDREGKDSWRFSRAGADVTAVASAAKAAFIEHRCLGIEEIISRIRDVDLILTEGYKHGSWAKIAVDRAALGQELVLPAEACFAIVSDRALPGPAPVFPLDDPEPLAEYIMADMRRRSDMQRELQGAAR
jgi:molybdopterin-guanine dinucleotide biosynthesis protein MobB